MALALIIFLAASAAGAYADMSLAAAALRTSAPRDGTAVLPEARWVATAEWSECSNLCGEGEQTRQVACRDGEEYLCNTVFEHFPDTRWCQKYTECPYDWMCPQGVDAQTGEGCDTQRNFIMGSVGASSILLAALCAWNFVRVRKARRARGALRKANSNGDLNKASAEDAEGAENLRRVTWDVDDVAFDARSPW